MNKRGQWIDFDDISPMAGILGVVGGMVGALVAKFYSRGLPGSDGHASIFWMVASFIVCGIVGFIWGQKASE